MTILVPREQIQLKNNVKFGRYKVILKSVDETTTFLVFSEN